MVGIGGFLGAIARFSLGVYIGNKMGARFPYATFVINVSGSFLIGMALSVLAERSTLSPNWRYLIPVGFVVAFTTFSTFEFETLRTIQDGQVAIGLLNIFGSVIAGFIAVWLGVITAKLL
jgi:CrcB protein